MKKMKQFLSSLAAVLLLVTAVLSTFAASYADVDDGVWYADAVNYVTDNNLMDPLTPDRFAPDTDATRSALAVALYRAAGSPQVGAHSFNDIPAGSSYANAAAWASANGVISGYPSGDFGGDDPITREQIVTILWRYAGSPTPGASQDFADESSISAYAAQAVDWSHENGVVSGYTGGRFAPQDHTTRAQLAVILRGYLTRNQQATDPVQPGSGPKTLVVYFSRTNNTKGIAQKIQTVTGGDMFEIEAQVPYTDADINYNDNTCRANREQGDPSARPAITGAVSNLADYDVIFLGYPIWHGQAPKVIYTFLERCEGWNGQTIVPFCTSASSPIGSSADDLHNLISSSVSWMDGRRFSSNTSQSDVTAWIDGLNLNLNQTQNTTTTNNQEETNMNKITLSFNGHSYTATLADNSSAEALKAILANGPLTIDMSDYASMEKVGPIGQSLPTNNQQITTQAGDLILYQGSNLVIYYAPNSWNFTRLGRIDNPSGLWSALGSGNVSVTLTLG